LKDLELVKVHRGLLRIQMVAPSCAGRVCDRAPVQNSQHGTVHVVDRCGKEEQAADDPTAPSQSFTACFCEIGHRR